MIGSDWGLFSAQDEGILSCKIGMAALQKPTSMGRSGSMKLHQDRTDSKEGASSRGLSGGRKVLVSEFM